MDYDMIRTLLHAAKAQGLLFVAHWGDDCDYRGNHVETCVEALEACDEMQLRLIEPDGRLVFQALVIMSLDNEERLADWTAKDVPDWILKIIDPQDFYAKLRGGFAESGR